jgi:hypothetical protein
VFFESIFVLLMSLVWDLRDVGWFVVWGILRYLAGGGVFWWGYLSPCFTYVGENLDGDDWVGDARVAAWGGGE